MTSVEAAEPEAAGQMAGILVRATDRERYGRTGYYEFIADAQGRSTARPT